MDKKLILVLVLVAGLIVTGLVVLNPTKQKGSLPNPLSNQQSGPKEIKPSETLKEYTDPSGFTLSYPDNLSLVKNEITDNSTYTDIQLTSKDVSGSLSLKISDSKFTTLDEWLKSSKGTTKEVKLGSLKGIEVTTNDRLLLGALDNGVFFDIEMPLIEKDFWMKVYDKVLTSFSFTTPDSAGSTNTATGDITFEGEETVE